jgi:hypothetical protein
VPLPLPNTTFNLTQVAFEPTVYVYSHPRFAWWVEPGARRLPGDLYAAQLALRNRSSYNPLSAFVYGQLLEDPESGLGERDVAALMAADGGSSGGGGAAASVDGTGGWRVGCSCLAGLCWQQVAAVWYKDGHTGTHDMLLPFIMHT